MDESLAGLLAHLKWIRFLRFSCDQAAQIDAIPRTAELLGRRGVKPYRLFVYLLVTEDVDDAAYRVERLRRLQESISLPSRSVTGAKRSSQAYCKRNLPFAMWAAGNIGRKAGRNTLSGIRRG